MLPFCHIWVLYDWIDKFVFCDVPDGDDDDDDDDDDYDDDDDDDEGYYLLTMTTVTIAIANVYAIST